MVDRMYNREIVEEAWAPQVTLVPTLLIGLGGAGGEVIRKIKARNRRAFDIRVPIFQYLVIDTEPLHNLPGQEPLDEHEYASLGGYNPSAVAEDLDNYPLVEEWWPYPERLPSSVNFGAGLSRAVGRLSLFVRHNEYIDKIEGKMSAMEAIRSEEWLREQGYEVLADTRRVYIVSSLCGGTGSGIFLDVAYRVRYMLRNRPNVTITGILILPPAFDEVLRNPLQEERVRANAYAALMELDHFVTTPHFKCNYADGTIELHAPPFEINYLVDIRNQRGQRLRSLDDVCDLIGQAVFLEVGSTLGSQYWRSLTNVVATGWDVRPYRGRARSYSSLSAASLIYPRDKILGYCADHLAQALITEGFLRPQTGPAPVGSPLPARLQLDNLRFALSQDEHGTQYMVNARTGAAIRRARNELEVLGILGRQEQEHAGEVAEIRNEMDRRVATYQQQALDELKGALVDIIKREGLPAGKNFLNRINEALQEHIREVEQQITTLGQEIEALRRNYDWAKGEIDQLQRKWWYIWFFRRRRRVNLGNECNRRTDAINAREIRLWATRKTLEIYQKLVQAVDEEAQAAAGQASVRQLLSALEVKELRLGELAGALGRWASQWLDGRAPTEEGLFDLSTEVVKERYIKSFYTRNRPADVVAKYQEFMAGFTDFDEFWSLSSRDLERRLAEFGRGFFEQALKGQRILDIVKSQREGKLKLEFLFNRCHPFWDFHRNRGISEEDFQMPALFGVDRDDPDDPWLTDVFRNFELFNRVSTNNPYSFDAARTAHGLPICLLDGLAEYKLCYDQFTRTSPSPLHIDIRWQPKRKEGGTIVPPPEPLRDPLDVE